MLIRAGRLFYLAPFFYFFEKVGVGSELPDMKSSHQTILCFSYELYYI